MTATNTNAQLNSYIRLPRILNGLSFSVQKVIGEIFSFTGTDKSGKQLTCYRSYEKFVERCYVSRATVGRALKTAREMGLIKGNHKNGYESLISASNGEFLRLPDWVMRDKFFVRENIERKLTKSEQDIYAYIFTRCTNKKNSRHTIEISISKLASELNISERTVQSSLWTLIRTRLIYRPKEDKGINAYKVSKYTLNYKLVLAKEKNEKKIRKEAEKTLKMQAEKALKMQAPAEPFPELNKENQKSIELVLQDKSSSKTSVSVHKQFINIDVIDINLATTAELEEIKAIYAPVWSQLTLISQTYLYLVKQELKRRHGGDEP